MNKLYLKIILSLFTLHTFAQVERDTLTEPSADYANMDQEDYKDEDYEEVERVVNVLPYSEDNNANITLSKFKTDYKKKYKSNDEFDYSEKTKTDSLWKRFKTWLKKKLDELFKPVHIESDTSRNINNIYRIASILVIALLVYYIIRALIQKDMYWLFKKKARTIDIPVDDIELNLETVNFPILLNKTIDEKQYRLSIRYYYLWLLQRLQEQQQIVWNIEKTNSDYLNEIKDEKLKEEFQYLSYIYNNIWYGEFEITETEFKKAQDSFKTLLKQS
ncbi:DUF4129 domain-containing protein [Myroides sp. M-43]|uniref:DUF4129 domain-containing protein n=1 Tax=Myroides oncorhynchi TaxID=2893756 RepID=UPI001E58C7D9|nr:DUF4129 domain-containing protein [Myroides oncorhynchi]MCC9043226.1 DUF4129 domain-containing protein [Myroides oncorhynchi]